MASTTLSANLQVTKRVSRLAIVAIAGVTYFTLAIATLHFLRPDSSPINTPTSEYAVGRYGFLMTTAFFSIALVSFALALALCLGVPGRARSRVGVVLLGVWGTGALIAMLFSMDVDGAPQTLAGTIHRINGPIAFLCATVGALLISLRFKHDEKWRSLYLPTLLLSLVMLGAYIGTFVSVATDLGFAGLMQRIDLVALVAWSVLIAFRLRATAPVTL